MKRAYTVTRVREAERALMARLPAGTLMQRAAAGLEVACAERLRAERSRTGRSRGARSSSGRSRGARGGLYGARLLVLAGSGDNGGDALWAGARLARRGVRVHAILLNPARVHAQGLAALRTAGGSVAREAEYSNLIAAADLVLDGIVGIGGKPGLRPDAAGLIDLVSRHRRPVLAVDVPSGIDVDTGRIAVPCVRAVETVSFGTYKPGTLIDPGAAMSGTVRLVDIGLGPQLGEPDLELLEASDVAALLPVPERTSQKYSRGVLGVLAGSDQFTGAAVLATGGALAAFVGMVRYAGPPVPADLVRAAWPEVVIGNGRVQAWLVGSGLGDAPERAADVRQALADQRPVLVDADGLRHLPERFDVPALLTPHEGELARMLGVERDAVSDARLRHAREAAERWNATVLLKGATTVVAAPDGRTRVCAAGTPWLATAGSGDVLSGVCGSLLASGLDPLDAGSVGAWLHQRAGSRAAHGGGPADCGTPDVPSDGGATARSVAGGPITPRDIITELPTVIRELLT